jgi:hypothetical protein
MPLQIGAPDVAFPRLNMFSYWLFLFGGLIASAGFIVPGGAASFGWTAYTPLSDAIHSPGVGGDLWIMGLYLAGLGTILGAVNFVTTIFTMRAPGMTMFRMPIFTWNILVTSMLVLIAFPILAGALLMLEADRRLGANVFDAANGGALLWQHLFWFFGHPEVYIIALPFFGIITEILPVFSRKPIFGYIGLVAATLTIAAYSVAVWAHHMFVTGGIDLYFFSFTTFLIAIPTGVKFFNWIGTMWGGSVRLDSPMLWSVGFLVTFLFGGLTGIILATPALDFQLSDSYFVVAHFHYVVFGTVVFAMFAGFYFWWPKLTGRLLDERLAKIHFWLLFVGFHMTFLVQHWLGAEGMPRRYADYWATDNFTLLNQISSVGAFLLGASMIRSPTTCGSRATRRWSTSTTRGAGALAGVGHVVTAAAPQLRDAAADPLREPGLRPAPPGDRGARHGTAGRRQVHRLSRRRGARGAPGRRQERPGAQRRRSGQRHREAGPMKVEAWTFGLVGIFVVAVTPVYWFMSEDWAGTSALVMTFLLLALVAFFLLVVTKQIPRRPEDRKDAEIADGAGELGFFPPFSWWPLYCAGSLVLIVLGVVFGWWLSIVGVAVGIITLMGWTYEFYRGYHAH